MELDEDQVASAIRELAYQFGVAFSTSAVGLGGTGGVVEYNGVKHDEALQDIADALREIANAIRGE